MTAENSTIGEVKIIVQKIADDVAELKAEFKRLNGTVRENCMDVHLLKDWRMQVAPKLEKAQETQVNLRVELARVAGQATIVGAVMAAFLLVARALGLF